MQPRDLLNIIWRRRIVVGLVFVLCVGAAAAYAYSQPKRYEAAATITFMPNPHQGQFIPSENLSALLSTYAVIAGSDQNLTAASAILGHHLTGSVSTSTAAGSWVLEIFSEDASPRGAAETVRAATQALVNYIHSNGVVIPTIVNPPAASNVPSQPRPGLTISVAVVIGLIAGVLLALLLENLRSAAESPSELPAPGKELSDSTTELAAVRTS
jgi:capsular polysaccharide biosynthesis protein